MKTTAILIFLTLLLTATSLSVGTRPASGKPSPADPVRQNKGNHDNNNGGMGGFFGPGGGFNIPGLGNGFGSGILGGGYGSGYGGPTGGHSKGGVVRPTVVCKERGPCYQKKVTCPARCFSSFSRSGKGYGAGGGGGSCTVDCKKRCTASC
ncbi:hypothetical protein L6164_036587 [Bauhinia variegata]|uniref:Uncharacterized protein n=1 Tax=Bauhinia variegata TaxID=167791 RepID=A0ACB9KHH3_BAUVA|nr:hypothetical protein L6164_036587 [Bauhinia variegata]